MIVRRIKASELWRTSEMSSVAYEFPVREPEDKDAWLQEKKTNPNGRSDLYWDMRWAAFADDDTTMMSTMAVMPFKACFDGHQVRMDGIGGVASFPQYRNSGCVRACFEAALPVMYEEGAVLSYLHPFRNEFYRKFGYEIAGMGNWWTVDLAKVPRKKNGGSCVLLESGMDLREEMKQIAGAWEKRYNCMVICEDVEYAWSQKANPFKDKMYTYLYRDAQGEPKGYMSFRIKEDDTVECRRFVCADREGFEGLISLLASTAADHSHASFLLPEDIDLDGILPEWQKETVRCERVTKGMARVINVEAVLRLAKMRGEGSLVIEVSDPQIAQNNGRFAVSFAKGQENHVERTDADADISLTIQDFTRLIIGKHDVQDFVWLPQVQLHCDSEKAAKVFYRKPVYLCQGF